jgi:hypothetical protein
VKQGRKAQRRAAAGAEQERRWRQAEAESPISREQLLQLVESVADRVAADGHDSSFKLTLAWCAANAADADRVVAFLGAHRVVDDYSLLMEGDPYKLFGPTGGQKAWMPLDERTLYELIRTVDESCRADGCDNSHRFTRRFLEARGLPVGKTEMALLAQGGGCDCEVVLNVDPERIFG